jgi:hypothetical protein
VLPPLKLVFILLAVLFIGILPLSDRVAAQAPPPPATQPIPPPATDAAPAAQSPPAASTPTPGTGEAFAGAASALTGPFTAVNAFFLEFVKFLVLLLGSYVGIRLFRDAWRRPQELIFPNITNSTGEDDLDKATDELSFLARAELVTQLERLHERMRTHGKRIVSRTFDLRELPKPVEIADQRIENLINSVAEASPDQAKQFVQFLRSAFPARGTRVSMRLIKGKSGAAIAMEVTNLDQGAEPALKIVDEGESVPVAQPPDERQKRLVGLSASWLATNIDVSISGTPAPIDPPLAQRFGALVEPASRWLAFKLTERQLLRRDWRIPDHLWGDYQSRVHYFLGPFMAAEGRRSDARYAFFLDDAVSQCQLAVKKANRPWYKPHRCIADTLLESGRRKDRRHPTSTPLQDRPGARNYEQALTHYETAKELINEALRPTFFQKVDRALMHGRVRTARWLMTSEGIDDQPKRLANVQRLFGNEGAVERSDSGGRVAWTPNWTLEERDLLSDRKSIAIGRATVLLLLSTDAAAQEAVKEIEWVEQQDLWEEFDEGVFFDLAIWYALAFVRNPALDLPADAQSCARRYLVCGFARDSTQSWWKYITDYEDLKPVVSGIARTKELLLETLSQNPLLHKAIGPAFVTPIESVLEKAGWLSDMNGTDEP